MFARSMLFCIRDILKWLMKFQICIYAEVGIFSYFTRGHRVWHVTEFPCFVPRAKAEACWKVDGRNCILRKLLHLVDYDLTKNFFTFWEKKNSIRIKQMVPQSRSYEKVGLQSEIWKFYRYLTYLNGLFIRPIFISLEPLLEFQSV